MSALGHTRMCGAGSHSNLSLRGQDQVTLKCVEPGQTKMSVLEERNTLICIDTIQWIRVELCHTKTSSLEHVAGKHPLNKATDKPTRSGSSILYNTPLIVYTQYNVYTF